MELGVVGFLLLLLLLCWFYDLPEFSLSVIIVLSVFCKKAMYHL